jgi:hypothetical protein
MNTNMRIQPILYMMNMNNAAKSTSVPRQEIGKVHVIWRQFREFMSLIETCVMTARTQFADV